MVSKQKVLLVCTLNSFRSQIEGSHPGRVHTNAISAMKEIKIDISNHISNWVFEYFNIGIDVVISVCDGAKLACPIFPKNHEDSLEY